MLTHIFIITICSYLITLLERRATWDIGHQAIGIGAVNRVVNNEAGMPTQHRPLSYLLMHILRLNTIDWQMGVVYLPHRKIHIHIKADTINQYYILKFFLILGSSLTFYWYLWILCFNPLVGSLLFLLFVSFGFMFDYIDCYLDIIFIGLVLIGILSNFPMWIIGLVILMGSLNRETIVVVVPFVFYYYGLPYGIALTGTFLLGRFLIKKMYPRKYKISFVGWDVYRDIKNIYKGINSPKETFINEVWGGVVFVLLYISLFFINEKFTIMPIEIRNIISVGYIIFGIFIILISIPGDIREIRIYYPTLYVVIPLLMSL